MRLSYTTPSHLTIPSAKSAYEAVKARRAPGDLITLDWTLLHSPDLTIGWGAFLGAIRTRTHALPATYRELAMARVAILNRCWIEWNEHFTLLSKTEEWLSGPGAGAAGKATLQDPARDIATAEGWTRKQIAVIRYADAMTKEVFVPDEVFEEIRACCDGEQEVVELTATIAAYNCVTRFLIALDVDEKNGVDPREA